MLYLLIHRMSFTPPQVQLKALEIVKNRQRMVQGGKELCAYSTVGFSGAVGIWEADKFERAGLTPMKPSLISSMLIEECPVNMECRVIKELSLGSHDWFIGEVVAAHKEEGYSREKALSYWQKEYRAMGEVVLKK